MSRYTYYYNTRQIMYRELATRWSKWAATASLTEEQNRGASMFFKSIAIRFGLIKEFREIGVI
jgi:hypothetical protein